MKKLSILIQVLLGVLILSNCAEKNKDQSKSDIIKEDSNHADYLLKGKEIAMSAQAILGKNLLTAISNKGTDGALSFCNERAIPLTDSVATALKTSLSQVLK